jgi:competence protein ComEA
MPAGPLPLPRPRSRWATLAARVRASTWVPIAARVAAVMIALVVLGWIGRTAAARPTTTSDAAGDRDASAAPLSALVTADAGGPVFATTATPPAGAPVSLGPPLDVPAPAPAGASHGRATPTEPVYLNQASVDELRRLPGVGPKRAEAILVLRQRLGRFQRIEDLLRVKGVGRGAVKKWRPLVRLDAPPASSSPLGGAPDGGST